MRRMMKSPGMLLRVGIFGAVVFHGLGSLAMAQVPKSKAPALAGKPELQRSVDAEPNSTLASFGDWVLRCQRLGSGTETQRVCEVAQQIRAQDQQNPVAELAIGRLKKTDPLRSTLVLPVNVTFSKLPNVSTDGKLSEPLDFSWRKCFSGGCIADALLKDDMLRSWKSPTNSAHITWTDAAGRDLAIGLSFHGLTQALDALSKEP
jgi:invasion protein IalB